MVADQSIDLSFTRWAALRQTVVWHLLSLLALLWSVTVQAAPVDTDLRLPLTIPYALLDELVWQQDENEAPAEFVDGPCRRLRIDSSWLDLRDEDLYLVSSVDAALGVSLFGNCIKPINWRGTVDVLLEPYIDSAQHLRFHLGKAELRNSQGKPATLLNFVGSQVRPFIGQHVEQFSFDLGVPREQINELLSEMIEPEGLSELQMALAGLQLGKPQVMEHGILIEAQLTLPMSLTDRLLPPWQADKAGPASAEQKQLQLERLDAFVVAVVKMLGKEITEPMLRQQLITLLLDSRYRLVEILSTNEPFEDEPVRSLFLEDWERLRAVLLNSDTDAANHPRLLRYATFLNAGDILLALDHALPQLGLWISLDGLRVVLRELTPDEAETGLEYGYGVDPVLRELFGIPPDLPPLPPEDYIEKADDVEEETPIENVPPSEPDAQEDSSVLHLPIWARLLDALIPNAEAATAIPERITELQRALGNRIPRRSELSSYAAQIAELLEEIGQHELANRDLDKTYAKVYLNLLPATALMESCWQQFKREDGKVTHVVSSAGAVGMMQVNLRVWRGLYDAERLKREVAYNARAGAQILLRYLEGPGLDVVKRTGNPGHLARASYAAYNAGPGGARRFLGKKGELKPGPVDRKLWSHYQGFVGGGVADLDRCTVTEAIKDPRAS